MVDFVNLLEDIAKEFVFTKSRFSLLIQNSIFVQILLISFVVSLIFIFLYLKFRKTNFQQCEEITNEKLNQKVDDNLPEDKNEVIALKIENENFDKFIRNIST
jgi:hypothetical protein